MGIRDNTQLRRQDDLVMTGGRRVGCIVPMLVFMGMFFSGCATENDPSQAHYWDTDAERQFETASDTPPTPQTLCLMARILAYQGKDSYSEQVFNRVLSEHKEFLPAYCDLAELQVRQGRLDDAARTLAAGLEVSEKDPILLNNLGLCMIMSGRADEALTYFLSASDIRPDDARFHANAALALGLLGRYEESLATYRSIESDSGQAHYNLAVVCEARGDYENAGTLYTRAATLNRRLDVEDDLERIRQYFDPQQPADDEEVETTG